MNSRNILLWLPLIFLTVLAGGACTIASPPPPQVGVTDGGDAAVRQAASQVVAALKAQDGTRLAALVHPQKGVRFSSSAYVDRGRDLVFTRDQVKRFWSDGHHYTWGLADGTGDPIVLAPRGYYAQYIMPRDFLNQASVSVNQDQAQGNTRNNAPEVYPGAAIVEYYIAPREGETASGLDWAALRLVLEPLGDTWFLVGIIHDEWTI